MEAGAVVGDFTLLPKRNNESSSVDWRDSVTGEYLSHFTRGNCVYITEGVVLNEDGSIESHTHELLYSSEVNCRWRKDFNGASLDGIRITYPKTPMDIINLDIGCSVDRFIKQVLDIL
jgi:hypothetical protein